MHVRLVIPMPVVQQNYVRRHAFRWITTIRLWWDLSLDSPSMIVSMRRESGISLHKRWLPILRCKNLRSVELRAIGITSTITITANLKTLRYQLAMFLVHTSESKRRMNWIAFISKRHLIGKEPSALSIREKIAKLLVAAWSTVFRINLNR